MPEKPQSSLREPFKTWSVVRLQCDRYSTTRQNAESRFCVHHNEARLRLLSVVRRYVDTFSRQITNVPPVCIKAIAILAGPDFPISGILFTGPLTFPFC